MSKENITKLIKQIYENDVNQQLVNEVLLESKKGTSLGLFSEVRALLKKAKEDAVSELPLRRIQLARTELMAASSKNLADWFAQPLVFEGSGMLIDIRKVLGSNNEVDLYIQSNNVNCDLIEESLLPFRGKELMVRFSVNGKELLHADIYVDQSGHSAEGSGLLESIEEKDVHGTLEVEILVKE